MKEKFNLEQTVDNLNALFKKRFQGQNRHNTAFEITPENFQEIINKPEIQWVILDKLYPSMPDYSLNSMGH